MTYTVSSGTLNSTIPYYTIPYHTTSDTCNVQRFIPWKFCRWLHNRHSSKCCLVWPTKHYSSISCKPALYNMNHNCWGFAPPWVLGASPLKTSPYPWQLNMPILVILCQMVSPYDHQWTLEPAECHRAGPSALSAAKVHSWSAGMLMSCSSWVIQVLCGLPGVVIILVLGKSLGTAAWQDEMPCEPRLQGAANGHDWIYHDVIMQRSSGYQHDQSWLYHYFSICDMVSPRYAQYAM